MCSRRLEPATLVLAYVPTGGLGFDVAFRIDGLSALVSLLVTSVALAVQVYSVGYLRGDPRYPSYVCLISLFTAAMLLVVTADDLLVLLVGWEVMGICSYFLIGHHWELAEARDGALKAFLVTRLGDVGFLFGIFVLGVAAGTFRISAIQGIAADHGLATGTATLATLLLLCGVVGKSAQFPLHIWLPDAMAGPTPVSALIHAATMVAAGVFCVARLLPVFELAPVTLAVLAVVATVRHGRGGARRAGRRRPQARVGLVDGEPARHDARRSGRGWLCRGSAAVGGARGVQGAAVPVRRRADPGGGQQPPVGDGWAAPSADR